MNDLALQIGQRHDVVIDHAQGADTGRREIHQRRRAEAAGADHQHGGFLQRLLAGPADLAQHDVARIAFEFFRTQHVAISLLRRLGLDPLNPRTRPLEQTQQMCLIAPRVNGL